MEIKLRDKQVPRDVTGIIKDIQTEITTQPQLPLKTRKEGLIPYTYPMTKELKAKKQELELKKAHTIAEAHRRRLHIM
ncbi:MAG: hypothetical protein JSV76_07195 [Candidatus Bathyarchaeota archaeon]|nr:MAG: hypothetical protein JSV76_07195 [Candidatus Bathyarchaeota archaeon]